MPQLIYPDSEVFNGGGAGFSVTGAPTTWQAIDEPAVTPNDGDYVSAVDSAALLVVGMQNATDPGDHQNHRLRVRHRVTGVASASWNLAIYENFSVLAVLVMNATGTFTTDTGLFANLGALITDYANLQVGFQFTGHTPGAQLDVSLVEFEVPDPLETRTTRFGLEVLSQQFVAPFNMTRYGAEVLAGSGEKYIRMSRLGAEVLSQQFAAPFLMTRYGVEVLARVNPGSTVEFRSTRYGAEVLSRAIPTPTVTPLPLPGELPRIFLHNWASALRLETAWRTQVVADDDTADETRRGEGLERPVRKITARFSSFYADESRALLLSLFGRSTIRAPFPLYCDQTAITQSTVGTTVFCDTSSRRFFVGGRVAVVEWVPGNRPTSGQYAMVQHVFDDRLELDLAVTATAGGRVWPVIDAEVMLEPGSMAMLSDVVADVTVVATEVLGENSLPALREYKPSPTFAGFPIYSPRADWSTPPTTSLARDGEVYALGLSQLVFTTGDRARRSVQLTFQSARRDEVWEVLEFFDSRRGSLRPLWVVPPEAMLVPISVSAIKVLVGVRATYEDLLDLNEEGELLELLGIVYADGTPAIHPVTSITEKGASGEFAQTYELRLGIPIPDVNRRMRRLAFAHFGRFDQDVIAEEWVTDEHCRVSTVTLELPEEVPRP